MKIIASLAFAFLVLPSLAWSKPTYTNLYRVFDRELQQSEVNDGHVYGQCQDQKGKEVGVLFTNIGLQPSPLSKACESTGLKSCVHLHRMVEMIELLDRCSTSSRTFITTAAMNFYDAKQAKTRIVRGSSVYPIKVDPVKQIVTLAHTRLADDLTKDDVYSDGVPKHALRANIRFLDLLRQSPHAGCRQSKGVL